MYRGHKSCDLVTGAKNTYEGVLRLDETSTPASGNGGEIKNKRGRFHLFLVFGFKFLSLLGIARQRASNG